MRRRWIGLLVVVPAAVTAQARPTLDVASLSPDAAAVYRTWTAYLASKHGAFSSTANVPSPLWVESEQSQWPVYDLAEFYLTDGSVPDVKSVERVDAPGAPEYRITTRFRSPGPRSEDATVTVYAVRDGQRWRLSNALPRNVRTWRRDTVGPITYVYAPTHPYDRARAHRAVAFTDSIAAAFGVPRLPPITYYLTSSVDEANEIMGLRFDIRMGPGGRAQPVNGQLFSGIPSVGEEYRHELAHLVLRPLVAGRAPLWVSEGVPTWLGGTTGLDFPAAARGLAAFLEGRPGVSLDSILSGSFPPAQLYPGAAVVVDMVFEQGGVTSVRALFDAGSSTEEVRASLERLLKRPWPWISRDWRRRVMRFQFTSTHGEYRGHYTSGFESSDFRPCEPFADPSGVAWVSFAPQLDQAKVNWPKVSDTSYPTYYVRWQGTLIGPGSYGHLGVATYQLTVERILEVRVPKPDDCR